MDRVWLSWLAGWLSGCRFGIADSDWVWLAARWCISYLVEPGKIERLMRKWYDLWIGIKLDSIIGDAVDWLEKWQVKFTVKLLVDSFLDDFQNFGQATVRTLRYICTFLFLPPHFFFWKFDGIFQDTWTAASKRQYKKHIFIDNNTCLGYTAISASDKTNIGYASIPFYIFFSEWKCCSIWKMVTYHNKSKIIPHFIPWIMAPSPRINFSKSSKE